MHPSVPSPQPPLPHSGGEAREDRDSAATPARRRFNLLGGKLGPFLALLMVFGFFAIAEPLKTGRRNFTTSENVRSVAVSIAPVAIGALGMTVIIIAGGIDLSVGTALALCATVLALCLKAGLSPGVSLLAAILTGCAAGFVNGALVTSLRVVPFIVTLGTMTIYQGVAKFIANETTVRPDVTKQVPAALKDFLSVRQHALIPSYRSGGPIDAFIDWFRAPAGIWLGLLAAALLAVVLRYTIFGRYAFAIGSNEAAARLCGISITRNKIAVYTLAGLFTGIAGVYQFTRLSSGNPTSGAGLELQIIAAVVIGGGSLSGGRGTVLGTLTGAAIMAVISSGCTQLELKNPLQDIILGVIIIAAVAVDQVRQRRLVAA